MTPKEKALQLAHLFTLTIFNSGSKVNNKLAKDCALIAVEEILKANPTNPLKGGYIELYSDMVDESLEYWQQVKTEIEKL